MLKLNTLWGRNYEPLNLIEISEANLIDNYKYLVSLNRNIQVAPVLKSNAYGHGISLIGKVVDRLKAPFVCVDSLFEAYELTKAYVKTPILVMGYISPSSLKTKKLKYSFTIFNKEIVNALQQFQPNALVHVFVDTGMRREGIDLKELPSFLDFIQSANLRIEGLMSHFGMSDIPNNSLTQLQVENFSKAQEILKNKEIYPNWIHIANSSGLLNHKSFQGKFGNVARIGKAFYGYDPEGKNRNLKPALELTTHIAQIKNIEKGEKVGYDFTFTAKKDLILAILPIGYNDGVDRRLSNVGYVTIYGRNCPIIGRVSMNITTIDITRIKNVKVGDRVTVFSKDLAGNNSIEKASELANTIPHEMLIHLNPTTKRVFEP